MEILRHGHVSMHVPQGQQDIDLKLLVYVLDNAQLHTLLLLVQEFVLQIVEMVCMVIQLQDSVRIVHPHAQHV